MNRAQRRELEKHSKGKVVKIDASKEIEVPQEVKNFLEAFAENKQSMDFFFKAVAVWTNMPLNVKEQVIVEAVKRGYINLEDGNEGKDSQG